MTDIHEQLNRALFVKQREYPSVFVRRVIPAIQSIQSPFCLPDLRAFVWFGWSVETYRWMQLMGGEKNSFYLGVWKGGPHDIFNLRLKFLDREIWKGTSTQWY